MYDMTFDIRIGSYRLRMVDSVTVKTSVEELTDTAVITLPASVYNVALNVEDKIRRGDKVSIAFGYDGNNRNYRNRRHLAGEIMKVLGCTYDEKQVGMFLWGKIPDSCKDVEELTEKVLHEARVFITPGFIFGSNGARYIRISLCCKDNKLAEALERIKRIKNK